MLCASAFAPSIAIAALRSPPPSGGLPAVVSAIPGVALIRSITFFNTAFCRALSYSGPSGNCIVRSMTCFVSYPVLIVSA